MASTLPTAALLASVFPGSDVGNPAYLEWLYERSPFGGVIEANIDDEQGRAAHYALVPVAMTRDGRELSGALSLNTAVHERARGGGAFVQLANEALREASARGVRAVVGVANANSTPGFLRRLDFELLAPLPATVMLPRPGSTRGIDSAAVDSQHVAERLLADVEDLLRPPQTGEARSWTAATLRWRLARPGASYFVHRNDDFMAVSCCDARRGVRVAMLLKVFARRELCGRERRALVRAACRAHRTPLALHVGLNHLVRFRGVPLPARLRESPLNLIYRSLEQPRHPGAIVDFEFLDFDAY